MVKGIYIMSYRDFLAVLLLVGMLASTTSPALASTFSTIDVPGATLTAAIGINDRGQIVGNYVTSGTMHGFLLDQGTFTTIDVPGASVTGAYEINARGQMVGFYVSGGKTHGFLMERD